MLKVNFVLEMDVGGGWWQEVIETIEALMEGDGGSERGNQSIGGWGG